MHFIIRLSHTLVKSTSMTNLVICIVPYYKKHHCSHAQIWATCNEGITQFCVSPIDERYLHSFPNRKASPPFDWY